VRNLSTYVKRIRFQVPKSQEFRRLDCVSDIVSSEKKSSAGPVVLLDIPPLQQEVQWNYFSAVRWMYLANEMFDFQTVD
jgi:hypothetical protein